MHRHIKKWGQVFLKNKLIQEKIGKYINSLNFDNLLEVGGGEGALTQYIQSNNLVIVEIDKKLAYFLQEKFPTSRVIVEDFLELKINNIFESNQKALIVGNIPYYITSPIISKFLFEPIFKEAVFMVQKEVFESITSPHSNKNYTSFSAFLQTISTIKKVLNVGRNNFFPIPKVDSVVIHFKKKESEIFNSIKQYSLFLKKSFFMPRKTLVNNWKKFLNLEQIEELVSENEIDIKVRPDWISPQLFEKIFLSKSGKKHLHSIL
ncbi:ribosomal RNA small subunit methyltransferase A [Candidatus Mycoplasma haematobovis]|uniref:Ribosomal RNA small subunit methyltransferase A n=1 Tax=Candidatus Mycoplasma haematobovis TaxID=432608 RepID=A0A1A9QE47_9MOLU|nr:16S rRNA (adenine(1518)-N(6)/adenine(1519)-N(6))-dimethyltransferase RsmA [Candidatus Mycoplasma haematobovis]OAL10271.1 ribosomal RNA small subunit methyltransferase A [Candidatus Mycoplasma haematobovis]